ncbi:unnamed protein product, partial [Discosporangium mesarthrocarpum]
MEEGAVRGGSMLRRRKRTSRKMRISCKRLPLLGVELRRRCDAGQYRRSRSPRLYLYLPRLYHDPTALVHCPAPSLEGATWKQMRVGQ